MVFYDYCPLGELQNFIFRNTETISVFIGDRNDGGCFSAFARINHLFFFCAEFLLEYGTMPIEGRFEDKKLVGIDRSLDDHLAEAA